MDQYEYVVDPTYAADIAEALVGLFLRRRDLWIRMGILYALVALAMVTVFDGVVAGVAGGLVVTGCGLALFVHLVRVQSTAAARRMYPPGTGLRSAFGEDSFVTENHFWTTRWRYEAVHGVVELGQFVQITFVNGFRSVYPRAIFPDSALERVRARMSASPTAQRTP